MSMSSDYKYAAYLGAEEIAENEFGVEFYDLPQDTQMEVYGRALRNHCESLYEQADVLRKSAREDA